MHYIMYLIGGPNDLQKHAVTKLPSVYETFLTQEFPSLMDCEVVQIEIVTATYRRDYQVSSDTWIYVYEGCK